MKTLSYALPRLRTTQLALLGILMALEIVIGRFTFGPASVKVGFTFIVVANRLHELERRERRKRVKNGFTGKVLRWTGTKRALVEIGRASCRERV